MAVGADSGAPVLDLEIGAHAATRSRGRLLIQRPGQRRREEPALSRQNASHNFGEPRLPGVSSDRIDGLERHHSPGDRIRQTAGQEDDCARRCDADAVDSLPCLLLCQARDAASIQDIDVGSTVDEHTVGGKESTHHVRLVLVHPTAKGEKRDPRLRHPS